MAKSLSRTILLVAALGTGALEIAGCERSASDAAHLQAENDALRMELQSTKSVLEDLKYAPSRLLQQAQSELDAGDLTAAKGTLTVLLQKHPDSREAQTARTLALEVDAAIASKEQEARERAEQPDPEHRPRRVKNTARIALATSKMRTKVDEMEKITWYSDKTTPRSLDHNSFHLYFGKRADDPPWLRLRIQYTADDWFFIRSFLVVADDQRYDRPMVHFERDHSSKIWEWYDEPASSRDIHMAKAIIRSKKAVIRLIGEHYHTDRTITQAEKFALQNVLYAYVGLGGRLP